MIITKTPLRISFVGGGSDLPAFYREEPGAVVSATIDKYVYVTLSPKFDGTIGCPPVGSAGSVLGTIGA